MTSSRTVAIFTFMVITLSGPAARADTVMLVPSKDNTLYENEFGTLSNGSGPSFFSGPTNFAGLRRALIAFDIAGNIPAGSTITNVELTLVVTLSISGGVSTDLRRVETDWGEGASDTQMNPGGSGDASQTEDATWIHTFYPDQFWDLPGGDFSEVISGSTSVGQEGTYTWNSTPQMVADVQDWLENPETNYGWVVFGNGFEGQAKRYASRENPTEGDRPQLVLEFDPPAKTEFGDCDSDGDVDLVDFSQFQLCFTGPGGGPVDISCQCGDADGDGDIDLADFGPFQLAFTGPM